MNSFQLRETQEAASWLGQFESVDRENALALLDGLWLVSSLQFDREMLTGLRSLLSKLKTSRLGESSAAMFASRGRPRDRDVSYFHAQDPSVSPSPTGPGSSVGSEGEIAHLLRDLSADHDHWYTHPSLNCLRSTRTKNWIIVDDLVATGDRGYKMIEWIYGHNTVKSWHSGKRIQFHYFAFAATTKGIKRIEEHRSGPIVHSLYNLAYGTRAWPVSTRSAVEGLCRQYASRHIRGKWHLGYKGALTNIIFEHGCPNTAPAIVHQKTDAWEPLFEKRPSAGFASWPRPINEVEQVRRLLAASNQGRLAQTIDSNLLSESDRLTLTTLALATRHRGKPGALSEWLGLSILQATGLLGKCMNYGWLTERGHLSDEGRAVLDQARTLAQFDRRLPLKTEPYIPHTLVRAKNV